MNRVRRAILRLFRKQSAVSIQWSVISGQYLESKIQNSNIVLGEKGRVPLQL